MEPPLSQTSDAVLEVAGRLYAGRPEDFTAARTQAEREAKAAGDRDLAAAVKALRRPSVGAWAVNQLVRRESEQIDAVLELAASLRSAAEQLDGAELRALTRQRRQLTSTLTTRARQLALESGARLTAATADQVEATLTAAMLDPAAADAVRSGLLVTTLSATGLGEEDRTTAVAVPEALGTRAAADAGSGTGGGPSLRIVPENRAVLREAARDRLDAAEAEHAEARRSAAKAARRLATLRARDLQLAEELDELQRRVAHTEEQLTGLADEIDAAEEQDAAAEEERAGTERARDAAQAELDEL